MSEKPNQIQIGGNHYKGMAIQPVEFIQANAIPYMEGNAIKYLCRWRNKNGLEDLKKARHYIDLLIQFEEGKTPAKPSSFLGWIDHDGKPLPPDIHGEMQVEVQMGSGAKYTGTVEQFYWTQPDPLWAIHRYRFL